LEKYGVDESLEVPESLEKKAAKNCPKCGSKLEKHGAIVKCPECGTAPFEKEGK
jgi:transposase